MVLQQARVAPAPSSALCLPPPTSLPSLGLGVRHKRNPLLAPLSLEYCSPSEGPDG